MKIALDATPLTLSSGGLRRYVEELSRALGDTCELIAPQPGRWWLIGLNRELARRRIDLFHGTNFEVPYIPKRASVMTIHDLSPWMDPSWHTGAARVRRRTPLLLKLGLANMIITPSKAVRAQVIERFGTDPRRVAAVPLAPAPHLHAVQTRPAVPYFLFVGTLEPRKNVATLVEAWQQIRMPIELVIAGCRRADAPALPSLPGLRIAGEVPDDQLSALYSGATACLYPSLYEGFGLPVLEAMCCGALAIASRDPAITEVAAGAAVQVDARDTAGWAEAMLAAATRPEWAAEWRARGAARAAEYSWARTAALTHEVYQEAVRRYGR